MENKTHRKKCGFCNTLLTNEQVKNWAGFCPICKTGFYDAGHDLVDIGKN